MSTAEPKLRKRSAAKAKASHTNGAADSSSMSPKGSTTSRPVPRSPRISTAWLCGLLAAFLAVLGLSMQNLWSSHTFKENDRIPFTSKESMLLCTLQQHMHSGKC